MTKDKKKDQTSPTKATNKSSSQEITLEFDLASVLAQQQSTLSENEADIRLRLPGGIGIYDQAIRHMICYNAQVFLNFLCRNLKVQFDFHELLDTRLVVLPRDQNRIADLIFLVSERQNPRQFWLLIFESESAIEGSFKLRVTLEQVSKLVMQIQNRSKKAKKKHPSHADAKSQSQSQTQTQTQTQSLSQSNSETGEEQFQFKNEPLSITDLESFRTLLPDGVKILTALFNLTKKAATTEIDFSIDGYGTYHRPLIENMETLPAQALFEFIELDLDNHICLLPLLILCEGGCEQENLEKGRQMLYKKVKLEKMVLEMFKLTIEIFAELKGQEAICRQYFGESTVLKETNLSRKMYLQATSAAFQDGQKSGIIEGMREILYRVLKNRFPDQRLPKKVKNELDTVKDPNKLDQWVDLAFSAATLNDFTDALKNSVES